MRHGGGCLCLGADEAAFAQLVQIATEGEREASLTQVRRILGSLALYYLPTIEAETLSLEAPGSTTTQDPPPTPGP